MKQNKILIVTTVFVLFLVLLSLGVVSQTVKASNKSSSRSKVISSIQINHGDTLWDIATEYYTDDYEDVNEFITEIKDCNGLVSDTIHAGEYLIIPYYYENINFGV